MREFISSHLPSFIGAVSIILIALAATIGIMHRRRNFEAGPKKGEAKYPQRVKQQNS